MKTTFNILICFLIAVGVAWLIPFAYHSILIALDELREYKRERSSDFVTKSAVYRIINDYKNNKTNEWLKTYEHSKCEMQYCIDYHNGLMDEILYYFEKE